MRYSEMTPKEKACTTSEQAYDAVKNGEWTSEDFLLWISDVKDEHYEYGLSVGHSDYE